MTDHGFSAKIEKDLGIGPRLKRKGKTMIHKEIEAGEVRLNHLLDRSDRDLGLGDIVSIRNHPGSPDGATPPQVTITALFEDGMTRAWSYGPTEIVKVAIPE